MQNSNAKKNYWKKFFRVWNFIENQVFMNSTLFSSFSVANLFESMQLVCLVTSGNMYLVSKRTYMGSPDMVSKRSSGLTRKSLEDVLRYRKEVLRMSPGIRLYDIWKNVVATSILDKSKKSLKPKLRPFKAYLRRLCVGWVNVSINGMTLKWICRRKTFFLHFFVLLFLKIIVFYLFFFVCLFLFFSIY